MVGRGQVEMLLRSPGGGFPLLFRDQLWIEKDRSLVEALSQGEGNPEWDSTIWPIGCHVPAWVLLARSSRTGQGPGLQGRAGTEEKVISRLLCIHLGRRTWSHPGVHSGKCVL